MPTDRTFVISCPKALFETKASQEWERQTQIFSIFGFSDSVAVKFLHFPMAQPLLKISHARTKVLAAEMTPQGIQAEKRKGVGEVVCAGLQ